MKVFYSNLGDDYIMTKKLSDVYSEIEMHYQDIYILMLQLKDIPKDTLLKKLGEDLRESISYYVTDYSWEDDE